MPRSSSPLNIFHEPSPTRKPWVVGRLPSNSGGYTLDTAAGFTPEGEIREESTRRGRVCDGQDPFFYLCVFGGTMSMTQDNMHECVEEMVQTRQEKEAQRERDVASADQLKEKVSDLIDAVGDAKVGRTKFALGGIK